MQKNRCYTYNWDMKADIPEGQQIESDRHSWRIQWQASSSAARSYTEQRNSTQEVIHAHRSHFFFVLEPDRVGMGTSLWICTSASSSYSRGPHSLIDVNRILLLQPRNDLGYIVSRLSPKSLGYRELPSPHCHAFL